ncbi:MAG TPA: protein kinase [Gemmatimonadales bacterium]|jgi:serine/threonine-protein kinase|nr:protein kinase [Gemmatimonadales bacterium]
MPVADVALAEALSQHYTLERELGRGGMATVYLARDLKHERPVALKVLRPEVAAELGVQRFLREIKLAAQLRHPHIVPLYDSGVVEVGTAGGCPYYVMPYITGESLRDRLTREKRLPVGDALRIAQEVAEALASAHKSQIVHRDIKPENILLEDAHAVVTDFGIARAISVAGEANLTGVGLTIGTPAYMSPEQVSGEIEVDGRTDIYSLGCMLFEMLTGELPFPGPSPQAMMIQRSSEPPRPIRSLWPEVPVALESALNRALARKPEDRFATATEVIEALRETSAAPITPGLAPISAAPAADEPSIAVLPFVNLSPDKETEYFSDGMTDEVMNALVQIRGLRVAARTSSFSFKGKDVDAREIGERLKVRTLLEGSVRKAGDRIRITAQLVNAADGYHLWSNTYERTLADVFAVQDELSRAIAKALTQKVMPVTDQTLVKPGTAMLEAYHHYLRGRFFWNQRSTESFLSAIECFEQAIRLDPDYAAAHAGLSYCQAMLGFEEFGWMAASEAMPKAKAAALRALELDEHSSEAHTSLGLIAALYEWDWTTAERELERGLAQGHGLSSGAVWYAMFLSAMERHEEAIRAVTQAQARDPLSLSTHLTVGRCLGWAGRQEEALAQINATLRMDSRYIPTYVSLARTYVAMERAAEGLAVIETGIRLVGRAPLLVAFVGVALARLGRHDEARKILQELEQLRSKRYVPTMYRATILAALGDFDSAFDAYHQAMEERAGWLLMVKVDVGYFPVYQDPRYQAMLRTMGLEKTIAIG